MMELVIALISALVGMAPGALIALLLVQRRIKEADATAARLRREVADLRTAADGQATAQNQQASAELAQVRTQLTNERDQARRELAVAQAETQKLRGELATVRNTLQRTAAENDTLRMELLMARSNQ